MDSLSTASHKLSKLRLAENTLLKEVSQTLKPETVLNAGAQGDSQDKQGKRYRDYFPNARFYSVDQRPSTEDPNHFAMDLHRLSEISLTFDLVLCLNVLEHVRNPFIVAQQLTRVLKPSGYLFVTVPFIYPAHPALDKGFDDYWRFTGAGLKELFSVLDTVWIREIPSVLVSVDDRPKHWKKASTATGIAGLFHKKDGVS